MSSMRLLIGEGITTFLQGVIDPNTNQALYQETKLGAIFDPTPFSSWAEVTFHQGKSGPYGSGGTGIGWRVQDDIIFKVTSGWRYDTDSTAATTSMLNAMDVLLPILHSHVTIPSPTNPAQGIASVWCLLEDGVDRAMPVRFPNGTVLLLWELLVTARQQYNVILQAV